MSTFHQKCRDKSGVSHCITWWNALRCKRVDISGATAFGVSGLSAIDSSTYSSELSHIRYLDSY